MPTATNDLRTFVAQLEQQGELRRVSVVVDPYLEIAAITDRVCKRGGPALWFERVEGYRAPVLTNLFGSQERVARALGGATLAAVARRFARELQGAAGATGEERLQRLLSLPAPPLLAPPALVPGELAELPALHSWPGDGGRYLTLPLVFTRDPDSGQTNCGMYRVQLLAGERAVIHWRPGSDAARHQAAWQRRGQPMPVAIVLGGPPALLYAAGAPLPPAVAETALAGWLAGAPVPLVKCQTCDLAVPAEAEAVLEGTVAGAETALEGPFGNHTGYYVAAGARPLFRLAQLRRRPDMLYPCTVVGRPPMEDCFLAKATERLWLPLLQVDFPQVLELCMPLEGIFHGCALLAVRPGGEPIPELLRALWQTRLLRHSRLLVALDEGTDVHNLSESFWRVLNQARPACDLILQEGKIGIDATGRQLGPRVAPTEATRELLARRWPDYGLD